MLNLSRRATVLRCFAIATTLWIGAAQAATPEQVSDFFRSVKLDDVGTVKTLLAATISPNAIDPIGGEPALVVAVRDDSMRVFNVLMAHPAINLELAAPNSNTALMMAAFRNNKPAVLALLAKGAQVNRAGWTALHYAAVGGSAEIVRILLEHHADIDAKAPGDLTPLMLAAREGQEAAAQLLLEAGANATLKSGEGLTAAQVATRADKPRIADAIAAHLALGGAPAR